MQTLIVQQYNVVQIVVHMSMFRLSRLTFLNTNSRANEIGLTA